MENKKLLCMHCSSHIANFHNTEKEENVIIPMKNGEIIKIKIKEISVTEMYGDIKTEVGYHLNTQLRCGTCGKKTTHSAKKWIGYM